MVGFSRERVAAIGNTIHPTKPGTVTVAGHPGQDLHPKTLNSILRQAGLK
jgi:predicted RNA binding protein YcfA (HicA-like mRNA interferase family)